MRLRHSLIALAIVAFGCGGSASETPWPAEPEGKVLGPAGETAQPEDGRPVVVPDGGAPNVEP
ncbi:MAG: hypothetical protein IPM54_16440 [Polyangiaceae bacterium]|nr:hypothetical protein [Polyangiaceae bacterium]